MFALIALLAGCNQDRTDHAIKVVPESELAAFLKRAKTEDFHTVARAGERLLKPGFFITDHKTMLQGFPSATGREGQTRYELMSFRRSGSAGGINLFLDASTGEIIQFLPFEATF